HPTAGKIERHEPALNARWQLLFAHGEAPNDQYKPFRSRLDWEIAQWALREKIPQKSVNRLLQIPELKERLGFLFSNVRSMLQNVDDIPERCGPWYTKRLSFKDKPHEFFTVRHCDPIDAIKGLWGDPAFSDHLIYKPAKLFRGEKDAEEDRIYSEMWT
ncbi:hypothetical protein GYMLUDRAFT_101665, partial [Collybiopsis luxurians FD-317 M1]